MISVILPVFNAEKYLRESIESILNQTYENFELIIVNDCSTDRSFEIIKTFEDNRIRIINNKINLGIAESMNRALEVSKYPFIARMDADDISIPSRFKIQIDFFKLNPEIDVLSSRCYLFSEKINKKKKNILFTAKNEKEFKSELFFSCNVANPTVMIRRTRLEGKLILNPEFKVSSDYELWSRLIFEANYFCIKEPLLYYRIHGDNISFSKLEDKNKNLFKILKSKIATFAPEVLSDKQIKTLQGFSKVQPIKSKDDLLEIQDVLSILVKYKIFNDIVLDNTIDKMIIKSLVKGKKISIIFNYLFSSSLLKNKDKLFYLIQVIVELIYSKKRIR